MALPIFAQWECRSQLSSNLKPIGNSKLYWASELTLGAGYLNKNAIFNSMGFLGVDYSTKKSTFFAEIGYKFWDRLDITPNVNYNSGHFGIRELFYQYKGDKGKLTLGVQSSSFDDNFLLNERMLGVNYKYNNYAWSINFNGGTVVKDFSRNGLFCSVGYLYDIIPGREIALVGNTFGQTNFAGATLKYTPSKAKKVKSNSSDEFSSDEFSSDVSGNHKKEGSFQLMDLGLILYSEFGSWKDSAMFMPGLFLNSGLPAKIIFKPEVLYQVSKGNNAIIYSLGIEKSIISPKYKFTANGRYFGMSAIDQTAKVMNSFSNIFMGDVIRLDSKDIPMYQIGAKISFPSIKTHFKFQYSAGMGTHQLSETDFEIGKRFGKHIQVIAIGGLINSNFYNMNTVLGRIECRISL